MGSEARIDPKLQTLLDKQEIHEVVLRYCRGCDRRDEELLRSVYHDDAWDDHGEWFNGRASEYVTAAMRMSLDFEVTSHTICNHLIDVEGDVAYSEAYIMAYTASSAPAPIMISRQPLVSSTASNGGMAYGRSHIAG